MPKKHCSCCRHGAPVDWKPIDELPYNVKVIAYWAGRDDPGPEVIQRRRHVFPEKPDRWEDCIHGFDLGKPTHFTRLPPPPKKGN